MPPIGWVRLMSFARDILKAKRQEMLAQISELRKGLREIDQALEILEPALGNEGRTVISVGSSTVNDAIIWAVSNGAGTPAEIYNFITNDLSMETSKNSVSTRLSKMKNEGLLDHDGEHWVLPKKAKGSDGGTSEPLSDQGPVGRERGFPPTTPEGSIPSGSTASQKPAGDWDGPVHRRPLDEEIPF